MSPTSSNQKRIVNGIVLLDKPKGLSSNRALQRAKGFYRAKKAGHTGSLDPLATGMLPLCFGEATKFAQYFLDADKSYYVQAQLGIRTTTSDAEGDIIAERAIPTLTQQDLDLALNHFRGETTQVPSMYSALKYEGRPLYYYARQGIEVPRKSRQIKVYQLQLLAWDAPTVTFQLTCSKGTYVRTIVDDLGEVLGCGAHVTLLHRQSVSPFGETQMVALDTLASVAEADGCEALDGYLLSINEALSHWPALHLTEATSLMLRHGRSVKLPQSSNPGWVRLITRGDDWLGVGEILADGLLVPRRLVSQ